jgi:ABC-type lipoprotein release transport system permease subunit
MHRFILPIRFLLRRRISYLAVVATGLCVFLSFVVVTVLSGLTTDFKDYIHSCYGDCVISTRSLVGFPYYDQFVQTLREQPFVHGVSPIIRNYAHVELVEESLNSAGRRSSTVTLMGIDPVAHSSVTIFGDWLCVHKSDSQQAFGPE